MPFKHYNVGSSPTGLKCLILIEFDDGSDWTLSKCLTHANWTLTYIRVEVVYRWVNNILLP